jgi:hypothetical protein
MPQIQLINIFSGHYVDFLVPILVQSLQLQKMSSLRIGERRKIFEDEIGVHGVSVNFGKINTFNHLNTVLT